MRSEEASIPTRGSRLVGLLSMIITRVRGLGLLPQESKKGASPSRIKAKDIRFIADHASGRTAPGRIFAAVPRRSQAAHTYEILPRMAGFLAPVADGTFDGCRFHV